MKDNPMLLDESFQLLGVSFWRVSYPEDELTFTENKAKDLGYEAYEFDSIADFENLLHPVDQERARLEVEKCIRGEAEDSVIDYRIRRKEGSYVWMRDIIRVDKNGEDGWVVSGVSYGIEGEKAKETEFQTVVDNTSDGILVIEDGKIVYASPAYAKIMGNDNRKSVGLTESEIIDLIHPDDREKTLKIIYEAITDQKDSAAYVYRARRGDGTYVWREDSARFIYDESGKHIRSYVVCRDVTSQKKAEEKLRANEERFRIVAKNSNDLIYEWDVDNNEIVWLGDTKSVFLSEDVPKNFDEFMALVDKSNRKNMADLASDGIKNRRSWQGEYTIRVGGEKKRLIGTGEAMYDAEGKPIKIYGSVRDITEQRNAENKLRESEEKYRNIFENAQDVFYEAALDGRLLDVSPSVKDLSAGQYLRDDVIGMNLNDLYADPAKREVLLKTLQKDGYVRDYAIELKNKDGSVVFCSISSKIQFDESGRPLKIIGSLRDNSERKRYEAELIRAKELAEESELRMKTLIDESPTGIILFDVTGKILQANKAILEMVGSPSKEKSLQINMLETPNLVESGFAADAIKCIESGVVVRGRIDYTSTWGKRAYLSYCLAPILKDGKTEAAIANVEDVTDLVDAQNKLGAALKKSKESDELKTAFLQNLSHEVRTPLNIINGFAEILADPDLEEEAATESRDMIKSGSARLISLIENVIALSRIETENYEPIYEECIPREIPLELKRNFEKAAKTKSLSLEIVPCERDVPVIVDRTAMRGIASSLLDNAIKFSEKGKILIACRVADDRMIFSVKDEGVGIPPEYLDKIFGKFVKVKTDDAPFYSGAGIGLTIAESLARRIGGRIEVESELGKGSEFKAIIPLKKSQEGGILNDFETSDLRAPGSKVLIAEDDRGNSLFLSMLMKSKGIDKLLAANGTQAVEKALNDPEIGVVLMDLNMPDMDGFEACSRIKKARPNVKIIAQTAYSNPENRKETIDRGFDAFLSKPIDKAKLLRLLEEILPKR